MHVMVLTYAEPKKGYLNFNLTQPLGNPTYSSPNLATLGVGGKCEFVCNIG